MSQMASGIVVLPTWIRLHYTYHGVREIDSFLTRFSGEKNGGQRLFIQRNRIVEGRYVDCPSEPGA